MDNLIVPQEETQKQSRQFIEPQIGQWYWVKDRDEEADFMKGSPDPEHPWFAIVHEIGSNYVEFRSPSHYGENYDRIHFDELDEKAIFEPDPDKVLDENCKFYNKRIQSNLKEIQNVCQSLGVAPQKAVESNESNQPGLVPVTSNIDAKVYKKDLIEAKEKVLPELNDKIEKDQKYLKRVMSYKALEMKAMVGSLSSVIKVIDKRIFSVTLYAGISEEVELVKEGASAGIDDKVHIMQRRLYMDEECLLNYQHGGMEFKDINEFDKWLSEEPNFSRCLPFSKCIVTFKVRKISKNRFGDDIYQRLINLELEMQDKRTFMYIRNGEKLYRMCTDLDFGEMIFPNITDFDPQAPKMIKAWGTSIRDILTVKDWEFRRDEEIEHLRLREQWYKDNPYEKWLKDTNREDDGNDFFYRHANPYRDNRKEYDLDSWKLLDKDNVFYDDGLRYLNEKMEEYNRIALIVQGLLDRSEILDPLPPVNLKNQMEFCERVKLIYDGEHALYSGEKPSIQEYIRKCNASITKDSVFIGQVKYWEEKMAEKENKRRMNNWREDSRCDLTRYRPYGNPGPLYISKASKLHPRVQAATFEWMREVTNWRNENYGDKKITRVKVPFHRLFNVSAYKLGDYKQFFNDPRTREEYLDWAPMLLAAEEYHAGTWDEEKMFNKNCIICV